MQRGLEGKKFSIGIYVRESRDENGENVETIETQRDLLLDHVSRNRLGQVFRIYTDDNVSGSGFERDGIKQLQRDVEKGMINLLLIKDLSRLGRNNAKTLLFLDFLEEYGVRVMTFDGRYDSTRDNDTVGIDTWYNERYVRDISRKIRANLKFKIQKGEYIGHAPYGYRKSKVEKNRLEIMEEEARAVRRIFNLYLEGYGYSVIASMLDGEMIPAPSQKAAAARPAWNAVAVGRIIQNRVYTGDTVQGVSEKISFKSKKTRRLPKEQWVITQNTHQPVISREIYEEAQKLRASKGKTSGSHKGRINLFKGLLVCGKCGSPMFARTRNGTVTGYICGGYMKAGKKGCSSHFVNEKAIAQILVGELRSVMSLKTVQESLTAWLEKEYLQKAGTDREIARLEQQLRQKKRQQEILYADRLDERISCELFDRMNRVLEDRVKALSCELERLTLVSRNEHGALDSLERVRVCITEDRLTNQIIRLMVNRIIVYDAGDEIPPEILKEIKETDKKTVSLFLRFRR